MAGIEACSEITAWEAVRQGSLFPGRGAACAKSHDALQTRDRYRPRTGSGSRAPCRKSLALHRIRDTVLDQDGRADGALQRSGPFGIALLWLSKPPYPSSDAGVAQG